MPPPRKRVADSCNMFFQQKNPRNFQSPLDVKKHKNRKKGLHSVQFSISSILWNGYRHTLILLHHPYHCSIFYLKYLSFLSRTSDKSIYNFKLKNGESEYRESSIPPPPRHLQTSIALKKFHFTLRSRESASFVRARYLLVQLKNIDK